MNGLEPIIRLHRWRLDEKRQEIGALYQQQQAEERAIAELEAALAAEQSFLSAADVDAARDYPRFARSVRDRQQAHRKTIEELEDAIAAKQDEIRDAFAEVKKFEKLEADRQIREQAAADRREQIEHDETGLRQYLARRAS